MFLEFANKVTTSKKHSYIVRNKIKLKESDYLCYITFCIELIKEILTSLLKIRGVLYPFIVQFSTINI